MKTNSTEPLFTSRSLRSRNQTESGRQPSETQSTLRRFAVKQLDELTALKERVMSLLEEEFAGTIGARFLRQVVNEAAALAATTSFPALVLPALAEEKARQLSQWAARQQAIRHQTFTLAA